MGEQMSMSSMASSDAGQSLDDPLASFKAQRVKDQYKSLTDALGDLQKKADDAGKLSGGLETQLQRQTDAANADAITATSAMARADTARIISIFGRSGSGSMSLGSSMDF